MRIRLYTEEELFERAAKLTGIKEKSALVRHGLETLIVMESAKRLARLGGTEKGMELIPRRRMTSR